MFFGEHGLTSTSANHMANIAQEKIVSNEAKLKNLNFVTTTVDIVGSPENSGKVIHKDGIYSKAREELHTRLMKPYSTEGTGEQMLIYAHTPSIDQKRVDDLFFDLQKWHRSNEQQLNRIKYNIRRKVAQLNLERSQEYRGKMEEYTIKYRELNAKFKEWKIKECKRISQLKIVIPMELQPICDELCELEK